MSAVTVITLTPEELREIIREEVERVTREPAPQREAPRILTTEEAAAHARRSPETIRDWIKSGRLRTLPRSGRQHYRIRLEDLEEALASPSQGLDADSWAGSVIAISRGR